MVNHHCRVKLSSTLTLVIEVISALPTSYKCTEKDIHKLINLRVCAWSTGSVIATRPGENRLSASATPLIIDANSGATKITKQLLEAGALVDKTNFAYETPLHIAARNGEVEKMEILLAYGANPQARDGYLQTPAMLAARHGHLKALLTLSRNGVGHDEFDAGGEGISHHAAYSRTLMGVFHLINSSNGDSFGKENKMGHSAMSVAFALAGDKIPMLLNTAPSQGAYCAAKSNSLCGAVQNQSMTGLVMKMVLKRVPLEILSKLLAHQDWLVGTPLYAACTIAASTSQNAIIDLLLAAGAALELRGGDEGTPLMGACAAGRLKVVKHLVRKGAKICYMEDGQVFSALRAAKYFPEIIRWLLVGRYLEGPKLLTN